MRKTLLTSLFAAALATGASAQHHPMGFIDGWELGGGAVSLFHNPQAFGLPEGDILNRIDTDDYSSWGRDPVVDPTYGTVCMIGVQFLAGDPNVLTTESRLFLQGWTEDPDKPDFPDVPGFDSMTGGSNFLTAGPLPPIPFQVTEFALTFTAPVCVQTEGDLFLGVNIGQTGTGEGVFVAAVGDGQAPVQNLTVWDDPGPAAAAIAQGSYVCVVPAERVQGLPFPTGASAVYAPYLAQNHFEVFLENASGGVCTTATNQISYDVSSPANGFGTTNFLSGVHPDASSLPMHAGRNQTPPPNWTGDRIGFVYADHRLQIGDPVCVGVAFQLAADPNPLSFYPGTGAVPTGLLLLDTTDPVIVLGQGAVQPVMNSTHSYGRFAFTIDLPAFSRDLLQTIHPTLFWQGFGLDRSLNVHASGVARQQF